MTHYGAGDLSKVIERQRKLKEPFGESTVMGWKSAVLEGCAHLYSHDVVRANTCSLIMQSVSFQF